MDFEIIKVPAGMSLYFSNCVKNCISIVANRVGSTGKHQDELNNCLDNFEKFYKIDESEDHEQVKVTEYPVFAGIDSLVKKELRSIEYIISAVIISSIFICISKNNSNSHIITALRFIREMNDDKWGSLTNRIDKKNGIQKLSDFLLSESLVTSGKHKNKIKSVYEVIQAGFYGIKLKRKKHTSRIVTKKKRSVSSRLCGDAIMLANEPNRQDELNSLASGKSPYEFYPDEIHYDGKNGEERTTQCNKSQYINDKIKTSSISTRIKSNHLERSSLTVNQLIAVSYYLSSSENKIDNVIYLMLIFAEQDHSNLTLRNKKTGAWTRNKKNSSLVSLETNTYSYINSDDISADDISADDIKQRIKLINNKFNTHLTMKSICNQMKIYLLREGIDTLLIDYIDNKPCEKHNPAVYYTRVTQSQLTLVWNRWLLIFSLQGKIKIKGGSIGSKLMENKYQYSEFLRLIKLDSYKGNSSYIKKHNEYVKNTLAKLFMLTGHRPINRPFPSAKNFNIANKTCFISDKETKDLNLNQEKYCTGREVPLSDLAAGLLEQYFGYLKVLVSELMPLSSDLSNSIDNKITGLESGLFFVFVENNGDSVPRIRDIYYRDYQDYCDLLVKGIQPNIHRHFIRTELTGEFSEASINYWMGHAQQWQTTDDKFSSFVFLPSGELGEISDYIAKKTLELMDLPYA